MKLSFPISSGVVIIWNVGYFLLCITAKKIVPGRGDFKCLPSTTWSELLIRLHVSALKENLVLVQN